MSQVQSVASAAGRRSRAMTVSRAASPSIWSSRPGSNESTSEDTRTVVTNVAARAAAIEWLRYWLLFMVILLGSVACDPGVIVNLAACALCQVADTAAEKLPGRETP